MKLIIDDRWMHSGGIGRYSTEIVQRFSNMDVDISYLQAKCVIKDPLSPLKLGYLLRKSKADVFWSPGFMPPAFSGMQCVITIHDLIHLEFGTSLQKFYYNKVIKPFALQSKRIITVSQYAKREIVSWLGCQDHKVVVIPHGLDKAFCVEGRKFSQGRPYLLYVGNYRVNKNLALLIRAYASSGASDFYDLVFTGPFDDNLMAAAQDNGVGSHLKFLGGVTETDIASVYRGSTALIFVSLMEGFGLPVIEAMGCGVPVLCSNTTALSEVASDAAIKVTPTSVSEVANGIKLILNDTEKRRHIIEKGLQRVLSFDWDKSANSTFDALNS